MLRGEPCNPDLGKLPEEVMYKLTSDVAHNLAWQVGVPIFSPVMRQVGGEAK